MIAWDCTCEHNSRGPRATLGTTSENIQEPAPFFMGADLAVSPLSIFIVNKAFCSAVKPGL